MCLFCAASYKSEIILFPGGVVSIFSLVEQCILIVTDLGQQNKLGCRCSSVTKYYQRSQILVGLYTSSLENGKSSNTSHFP